jgi:dienelactone hydrolase
LVVETDHTFPKESRRRAEDILEEVKATYYVQLFSGVSHGFGTRGDPEVENSRMFF